MSTLFSCDKCGRNFPCQANLEIHQYSHASERKLACSLCGASFSQESQVTIHEKFSCPLRKASGIPIEDVTNSKEDPVEKNSEESVLVNDEPKNKSAVSEVENKSEKSETENKSANIETKNVDPVIVSAEEKKQEEKDAEEVISHPEKKEDNLITNSTEKLKPLSDTKEISDTPDLITSQPEKQIVEATSLDDNSELKEKQGDTTNPNGNSESTKEVDPPVAGPDNFCAICNKVFQSTSELILHMKEHPAELSLQCNYCSKKFKHYGKFQNHVLYYCSKKNANISKTVLEEEDEEDYTFGSTSEMDIEKSPTKPETAYNKMLALCTCDLCGKTFESPKSLRSHTKKHKQMHALQCRICSKVFYYAGAYIKHVEKSHDFYYPSCPLCEKQCADVNVLFDHLSTHKKDLSKALLLKETGRNLPSAKTSLLSDQILENSLNVPKVVISKSDVVSRHIVEAQSPVLSKETKQNNAMISKNIASSISADPTDVNLTIKKAGNLNSKDKRMSEKAITDSEFLENFDFEFEYEELEDRSPPSSWSKKKAYTCFGCGKQCASIEDLKHHMQSHFKPDNIQEPQHMCIVCGQPFSSTIKLQRHLRAHIRPVSKKLSSQLAYQAKVNTNPYQNSNLELMGNGFKSSADPPVALKARKSVSFPSWKRIQSYANPLPAKATLNGLIQYDEEKLGGVRESSSNGLDLSTKTQRTKQTVEDLYNFEESAKEEAQFEKQLFQNYKNYYCVKCEESFTSIADLRNHNLTKHVPKKYSCKICNKTFFSLKFFRRHNKMHQPLGKNSLIKDGISLNHDDKALAVNRLEASVQIMNGDYKGFCQRKKYICDVCQKVFISLKKFKFHSRSHRRKCQICFQTLGTAERLAVHMTTEHAVNSSDQLPVNKLDDPGTEMPADVQPVETNATEISANVKEDSLVKEDLVPDVAVNVVENKSVSIYPKPKCFKSMYQCKTCYQKFGSLRLLQRHSSVYHRRRIRLTCKICDRNIRDLFSLQQHMLVFHNSLPASDLDSEKVFKSTVAGDQNFQLNMENGDSVSDSSKHKFRYSEFVPQIGNNNPESTDIGVDDKPNEENGNDFEAFLSDNPEACSVAKEERNTEQQNDPEWDKKIPDFRKRRKRRRFMAVSSNKKSKIQMNNKIRMKADEIFDTYPLLHYSQKSKKQRNDQDNNATLSEDRVPKSSLNLVANISPLLKQISPAKSPKDKDGADSPIEQKSENACGCLPNVKSDLLARDGVLTSPKKEFPTAIINDSDFEILRSDISKLLTHLLGDELLSNYGHRDLPIENIIAQILDEAGFSYCQIGSDWNNPLEVLLRNIKTLIAVTVTKEVRDAIGFDCKPIDVIVKEMITFCS